MICDQLHTTRCALNTVNRTLHQKFAKFVDGTLCLLWIPQCSYLYLYIICKTKNSPSTSIFVYQLASLTSPMFAPQTAHCVLQTAHCTQKEYLNISVFTQIFQKRIQIKGLAALKALVKLTKMLASRHPMFISGF